MLKQLYTSVCVVAWYCVVFRSFSHRMFLVYLCTRQRTCSKSINASGSPVKNVYQPQFIFFYTRFYVENLMPLISINYFFVETSYVRNTVFCLRLLNKRFCTVDRFFINGPQVRILVGTASGADLFSEVDYTYQKAAFL